MSFWLYSRGAAVLFLSNRFALSQKIFRSKSNEFIAFSNLGIATESDPQIYFLSCAFWGLTETQVESNFNPPFEEVPSWKADPPESVEGQQKTEKCPGGTGYVTQAGLCQRSVVPLRVTREGYAVP